MARGGTITPITLTAGENLTIGQCIEQIAFGLHAAVRALDSLDKLLKEKDMEPKK